MAKITQALTRAGKDYDQKTQQSLVRDLDAVINKLNTTFQEEVKQEIRRRLKFIPYAPICFTSAINCTGVEDVVKTALEVYEHGKTMISRGDLKRVLLSALASHMPPNRGGKRLKILRMYQKDISPPTFVTFVNNPELIHFSYRRYLENQLRRAFGFNGNPLQLIFSKRGRE